MNTSNRGMGKNRYGYLAAVLKNQMEANRLPLHRYFVWGSEAGLIDDVSKPRWYFCYSRRPIKEVLRLLWHCAMQTHN